MRGLRRFVALGDSMISDCYPGPGLGAASLIAQNADGRFPEFEGRDLDRLHPQVEFVNHSRTGWMLPDLLQAAKLLQSCPEPTVALLSAGGNDLLHALMEGESPEDALNQIADNLSRVRAELARTYTHLTVLYCLLYDPTDRTGKVASGRDYSAALPAFEALNQLLRLNFENVLDLHTHFLGHGIRRKDPDFEHHDPTDPSGWFKMDIEPNPRGASEIRRLFWEHFDA